MAKIEIEKGGRSTLWPLLLALVVIALVAAGVYLYMQEQQGAEPAPVEEPITLEAERPERFFGAVAIG